MLSAFVTRTGLCLPPNMLLSCGQVLKTSQGEKDTVTHCTVKVAMTGPVSLLSWLENHVPRVEGLDCKTSDQSGNSDISMKKQPVWADFVNLCSCIVSLEEAKKTDNVVFLAWETCLFQ